MLIYILNPLLSDVMISMLNSRKNDKFCYSSNKSALRNKSNYWLILQCEETCLPAD